MNKLNKIKEIISCWETGSSNMDYSTIYIYDDGPKGDQITIGNCITEFGNLKELITVYLTRAKDPILRGYLPNVGKIPLAGDKAFLDALKTASKSKAWKDSYEQIYALKYTIPAQQWANDNGFKLPLSHLCILDGFVHSGGMLMLLRKRFPEPLPIKGGSEKEWIKQYVKTRKHWLKTHSRKILNKTTYRMEDIQRAIEQDDWNLDNPFNANGVMIS